MTMGPIHLFLLALAACTGPEPDDAIIAADELSDHPGHPCADLPGRGTEWADWEAASRCTIDHCIGRVDALDPALDSQQLYHICMDGFAELTQPLMECQLVACARLLPAMPGLAYAVSRQVLMPDEKRVVFGAMIESSELLTAVLDQGHQSDCHAVTRVGGMLTTLQVEGVRLPWDPDSVRAGWRLAAWHAAHCPRQPRAVAASLYTPDALAAAPDDLRAPRGE
jgi:hypothetical protein